MNSTSLRQRAACSLALATLVGAVIWVYAPVVGHRFVNFDDGLYIYENGRVTAGVTFSGLAWAWTNKVATVWHPLTWIAHMLVCEFGGLQPATHLAVNLGLHVASTLLLFTWLFQTTRAIGRSFAVALLFGLHPANVETVAWASQLKSTLSTFFFFLTLIAYAHHLRTRDRRPYVAAVIASVLGSLAKPVFVTLPLVLMLLDRWPQPYAAEPSACAPGRRHLLPFWLVASASATVTLIPWGHAENFHPSSDGLRLDRLLTVPVNYVRYLGELFWPARLAVLYPERLDAAAATVLGAVALLAAVTCLAWQSRRRFPALFFGWSWFLLTLAPVSGVIRIGPHGWADRYLYVPSVGIFLALAWTGAELLRSRRALSAGFAAIACTLAVRARTQVGYWHDSLTLWEHDARVAGPCEVEHVNYGNALLGAGRAAEAAREFQAALRENPANFRSYVNLAAIAEKRGDQAEMLRLLTTAKTYAPDDARVRSNLGSVLMDLHRPQAARRELDEAIRLQPDLCEAHTNLGIWYVGQHDLVRAYAEFRHAAEIRPDDPAVLGNLQRIRSALGSAKAPPPP